jgi:hypothetical protein
MKTPVQLKLDADMMHMVRQRLMNPVNQRTIKGSLQTLVEQLLNDWLKRTAAPTVTATITPKPATRDEIIQWLVNTNHDAREEILRNFCPDCHTYDPDQSCLCSREESYYDD